METDPQSATLRERALARWEGEGGALAPTTHARSIDDTALRILARLGAALLDEWNEIPTTSQREIIRRARTLGASADHARIQDMLTRFLASHQNDC
jgi:hypothetical protein